jgi:hypothetical protein
VRKEVDRHFIGRPDYFEYYENGELDRAGIDRDGDGVVDLWQQRKTPASQPASAPAKK